MTAKPVDPGTTLERGCRPAGPACRRVRRAHPPGRAPLRRGVRRPLSRPGRGHPRPVPGAGGDGETQVGGRRHPAAHRAGRRRHAVPAAGRLPDPPRDRPGRHGRRLRGRAGVAGPPRGPQGAAALGPARRACRCARSSARPGRPRGCTTPTSCRSSASASTTACTTTSCSSSTGQGSTRSSPSCGRSARRRQARLPRSRSRRPAAAGSRRSTVSAAEVARSLVTGQFQPRSRGGRRSRATGPTHGRHGDPFAAIGRRRRHRRLPRQPAPAVADLVGLGRDRPALLAERGADRRPGGRGAGIRPRQGILHRDIKPSNLLLDLQGHGLGHRLRPGQGRRPTTT